MCACFTNISNLRSNSPSRACFFFIVFSGEGARIGGEDYVRCGKVSALKVSPWRAGRRMGCICFSWRSYWRGRMYVVFSRTAG